ncbi:hypothetical protein J2X36_002171 [Methylobacterium sp. BE186]|nr:hypothetical protein [Methylobacterium sp. BE186]
MSGFWRIFCAGCAAFFRRLGLVLGRWCDGVADWFEEQAR